MCQEKGLADLGIIQSVNEWFTYIQHWRNYQQWKVYSWPLKFKRSKASGLIKWSNSAQILLKIILLPEWFVKTEGECQTVVTLLNIVYNPSTVCKNNCHLCTLASDVFEGFTFKIQSRFSLNWFTQSRHMRKDLKGSGWLMRPKNSQAETPGSAVEIVIAISLLK